MSSPGALITIAIPTYNRCDELARCLKSCVTHAPDCPIIVVDDGGSDGTDLMIRDNFPGIVYLRSDMNRGPGHARNLAFAAAKTEYVAFFDSDVVLDPGWYEAAGGRLSPDTILAGRVEQPEGKLEIGPRKMMPWGGSLPCRREASANVASSNNMVVPVGVYKKVGGFDEFLGIYFEDSYFCICARRAGIKVRYVDKAKVVHFHNSFFNVDRKRRQVRNRSFAMTRSSRNPLAMAVLQSAVTMVEICFLLAVGRYLGAGACFAGLMSGLREGVTSKGTC